MKGKPIKSIKRMFKLSKLGRPVLFSTRSGHELRTNAAWVINYPARSLYMQIEAGYYYEYIPKKK